MSRSYLRYMLRRLAFLPVAVMIVLTLAFAIVNLTPGNPAVLIGGELASDELVQQIEHELGLDQPLPVRYWNYISGLAHGDLGRSYFSRLPVTSEIRDRLPNSLELVVMSLITAAIIGLGLGAIGSYFRGRFIDQFTRLIVGFFQSVPDFFIGVLFIYLLYYQWRLAPAPVGRLGIFDQPPPMVTGGLLTDAIIAGDWALTKSLLSRSLLPVLTLGIFYSAYFAKVSRALLADALQSKQVEFARACGLREITVMGYAFRQARTPILTYGAILFAGLVGGGAIVETVFDWGGLGQWAIESILNLDLPSIQGFILVTGFATLLTYYLLDLVVALLDPRIAAR